MKLRMQKCIALGLAAVLCLSGCGKKRGLRSTQPDAAGIFVCDDRKFGAGGVGIDC